VLLFEAAKDRHADAEQAIVPQFSGGALRYARDAE
jgi:hypothetical protein